VLFAGAAAALLAGLFLPFYRVTGTTFGPSSDLSTWDAFAGLDFLLFIVALSALGMTALTLAGLKPTRLTVALAAVPLAFAGALVALNLVDRPDALPVRNASGLIVDAGGSAPGAGAVLVVLGLAALAAGLWLRGTLD
jgi:hypothetical protein